MLYEFQKEAAYAHAVDATGKPLVPDSVHNRDEMWVYDSSNLSSSCYWHLIPMKSTHCKAVNCGQGRKDVLCFSILGLKNKMSNATKIWCIFF